MNSEQQKTCSRGSRLLVGGKALTDRVFEGSKPLVKLFGTRRGHNCSLCDNEGAKREGRRTCEPVIKQPLCHVRDVRGVGKSRRPPKLKRGDGVTTGLGRARSLLVLSPSNIFLAHLDFQTQYDLPRAAPMCNSVDASERRLEKAKAFHSELRFSRTQFDGRQEQAQPMWYRMYPCIGGGTRTGVVLALPAPIEGALAGPGGMGQAKGVAVKRMFTL